MDRRSGRQLPWTPRKFFQSLIAQLCRAVGHHVEWFTPDKDGVRKCDHVYQVEKTLGPTGLMDAPYINPCVLYLVNWFWELDSGRTYGFALPGQKAGFAMVNPLAYSDIKAWADMSQIRIQPWELRAIKSMDAERLRQWR